MDEIRKITVSNNYYSLNRDKIMKRILLILVVSLVPLLTQAQKAIFEFNVERFYENKVPVKVQYIASHLIIDFDTGVLTMIREGKKITRIIKRYDFESGVLVTEDSYFIISEKVVVLYFNENEYVEFVIKSFKL